MEALRHQVTTWEDSSGLDAVLIGYSAMWPQNIVTAATRFALTKRIELIVAHRPGVMHPAAAARCFGTLGALAGPGRLSVNLVTGTSDKDVRREGDYSDKSERYARAADYVELMLRCWKETAPFDYDGPFYKAEAIRQLAHPPGGHVAIYMGGDSDAGVEFGSRYADTYMLFGEPLATTRERIERIKATASRYGRSPSISLSLRLFVADTDSQAWELARAAEREIIEAEGTSRFLRATASDKSVGRIRQLAATASELHDDCFWTGITKLLGGFANTASLVGSHERVMRSLAAYTALGIDTFLITGGVDGFWHPFLNDFACRMKAEL